MKRKLIALCLLPLLAFAQWGMDFDEDWAGAVSRVSVSPTAFVTTWVTTSPGQSVTLPLRSGKTYNFTVDWGDGSGIGTVASFDAAAATHEYAAAGTYTVKIEGVLSAWYFNNAGSKNNFRTVAQWGSVGAGVSGLVNGFWGASASTSFASPVPPTWAAVTTLFAAWRGCSGLTSAPDVSALTNVTSLFTAWYGCSGLTSAPDVSALTKVTTLAAAWGGCSGLTSAPDVSALTNVTTLATAWQDCSGLTSAPDVSALTKVTSLSYTWRGCSGLTSAPDVSALTNVTTLATAWGSSPGLTSAPDVSALTKVTSLSETWRNCSGLTNVPALPASSTALTTTTSAFQGIGAGMKGTVVELWNTNLFPNITSFANTFTGCTGLDNYADIPNNWKGL